jgi:hypothetical protein
MVYLTRDINAASFSLAIIRDRDASSNYLARIEVFFVIFRLSDLFLLTRLISFLSFILSRPDL